MNLTDLQHKKILLVGYGKEGKSVEKFLHEKVPSCSVAIADRSQGAHYLDNQTAYDLAIRSPGVPKELIRIPHTTATNLFFGNIKTGVTIGVTGSKGKSTTSSLIYHILKHQGLNAYLLGNIGNPMLNVLLQPQHVDDIYVCELSSYQLDDIHYSPHISVVVSLFPEHINYHGSERQYYDAKKNIIRYAKKNDYFVYNPKFAELKEWAEHVHCKAVPYVATIPISTEDIPLIGEHNVQNVQAAVTVAKLLNVEDSVINEAIKQFKPLPHRLERVGEYKGIIFFDDAISTTPESTIEAIKALKIVDTVLLGGENRSYNFSILAQYVKKYDIKNVVLFPDSGALIDKALGDAGVTILHKLKTSHMEEAVQFAYAHTEKGKICLLSTASPSYSIWKNFEEKGELFQKFVRKYK